MIVCNGNVKPLPIVDTIPKVYVFPPKLQDGVLIAVRRLNTSFGSAERHSSSEIESEADSRSIVAKDPYFEPRHAFLRLSSGCRDKLISKKLSSRRSSIAPNPN
jgi:hypothetical protein